MKTGFLVAIFLCIASVGASADEATPKTDHEKFSYAIGYQIAESVKRQKIKVDVDSLIQAIRDDLSGAPLRISQPEMQAVVAAYQQKIFQELSDKNEKAGKKYLAANKKEKGVVELPSGLQYKIVKAGNGKKPVSSDTVTVHYRGTSIDGTEFDSSYARGEPATFQVATIISGWQEALVLMSEGAKWQVFIPPALAYGAGGAGQSIGPNETLVFEIELVSIVKE
ncbi:MAG: FKBP-type peptidyl-prolyl cis-trans isomerase [Gammaproteobacteria bacterium]|jgi:FKBP-type peptidyl-prolyl cis-trans isomerase FklB|nr:FKBP-type peptidyl-prolyl cis-trans isomerase [Gammaproteobacteria bacterium]